MDNDWSEADATFLKASGIARPLPDEIVWHSVLEDLQRAGFLVRPAELPAGKLWTVSLPNETRNLFIVLIGSGGSFLRAWSNPKVGAVKSWRTAEGFLRDIMAGDAPPFSELLPSPDELSGGRGTRRGA